MIELNSIWNELICEGGNDGHLAHLFDQGSLTFAEIRDIFKKLFTGKLSVTEKVDGMNLNVTYKDGQIMASRNKATLKDPMSIKDVEKKFDGRGEIKTAFVKSLKDLQNAFKTLDQTDLNKFFANGQNFMSIEIVYPSTRNVVHYGNRCLIVLHGLNVFDEKGRRVTQDKQSASELFEKLQANDALKQKTFEITSPIVLKLKNIKDVASALEDILADLDKIVDGLGYKATVADYAQERFKKYIVNVATKAGIDLNRNSDFVSELADRLSNVSGRRPTKSDIATYAKKEGLDVGSTEYKDFINTLDASIRDANAAVIMPLEDIVAKAGNILMKNMSGYVALDPAQSSQKLAAELDDVIKRFDDGNGLTQEKISAFKRNLNKLEKYGKQANPAEGLVFIYKGKPWKLTGSFAPLNQLLNFFKH